MSGIGFGELIILLLIGLIVLGPERLPRVANQLGGWLGQARRMTRMLKRQLEDELDLGAEQDIVPPARTRHASLGFETPPAAAGVAAAAKDDGEPEARPPQGGGADKNTDTGQTTPPEHPERKDSA